MATETLTSGTSWVAPTGVTSVLVEAWGAGAAGGGNNTSADGGGGGGGGAYAKKVEGVIAGTSYSYAIGQGGTGVASSTGNNGTDTTWRSTVVVAKAGTGGGAPIAGAGGLSGNGGLAASCTPTSGALNGGYGSTGRNSNTGQGGHGGSSAGTVAAGYITSDDGAFVRIYPTASTPTGGGHGGDGGDAAANGSAPASGNGGGGGGSGDGVTLSGGAGTNGKIVLTYYTNRLYFTSNTETLPLYPTSLGQKLNNQAGTASWWRVYGLVQSAPGLLTTGFSNSVGSVNGPTSGIEVLAGSVPLEFISRPLNAAVTISGSITFNINASESNALANAAVACRIDKVAGSDLSVTNIYQGNDDAELGTSIAAMTWSATPTSTAFAKGDRIRATIYFDDASANMATSYTLIAQYGSLASGYDSYIEFTEALEMMPEVLTTQVFPLDTASDVATASVDKRAWTTRGT